MTNERDKLDHTCDGANGSSNDGPRVVYAANPETTPEAEVRVLAAVYTFILECHATQKATEKTDKDEGEKAAEHNPVGGIVLERGEQ